MNVQSRELSLQFISSVRVCSFAFFACFTLRPTANVSRITVFIKARAGGLQNTFWGQLLFTSEYSVLIHFMVNFGDSYKR